MRTVKRFAYALTLSAVGIGIGFAVSAIAGTYDKQQESRMLLACRTILVSEYQCAFLIAMQDAKYSNEDIVALGNLALAYAAAKRKSQQ